MFSRCWKVILNFVVQIIISEHVNCFCSLKLLLLHRVNNLQDQKHSLLEIFLSIFRIMTCMFCVIIYFVFPKLKYLRLYSETLLIIVGENFLRMLERLQILDLPQTTMVGSRVLAILSLQQQMLPRRCVFMNCRLKLWDSYEMFFFVLQCSGCYLINILFAKFIVTIVTIGCFISFVSIWSLSVALCKWIHCCTLTCIF